MKGVDSQAPCFISYTFDVTLSATTADWDWLPTMGIHRAPTTATLLPPSQFSIPTTHTHTLTLRGRYTLYILHSHKYIHIHIHTCLLSAYHSALPPSLGELGGVSENSTSPPPKYLKSTVKDWWLGTSYMVRKTWVTVISWHHHASYKERGNFRLTNLLTPGISSSLAIIRLVCIKCKSGRITRQRYMSSHNLH